MSWRESPGRTTCTSAPATSSFTECVKSSVLRHVAVVVGFPGPAPHCADERYCDSCPQGRRHEAAGSRRHQETPAGARADSFPVATRRLTAVKSSTTAAASSTFDAVCAKRITVQSR